MAKLEKKTQRTCVVCKQKADKASLLRFVQVRNRSGKLLVTEQFQQRAASSQDNQLNYEVLKKIEDKTMPKVMFDELQKMSGRSAYCHNQPECLGSARVTRFISGSLNRGRYNRKNIRKKKR
ncbi:MAG: YlxR family protein [Deltaproteobacteria bacterium]|jgi:predicted RNA-binding protein YlxR (DUF448 family)|nr:YlxR family protein [Deltaproteobacteria bacterium]